MNTNFKPELVRPVPKRRVTLDSLLEVLSEQQFETILSNLRLGNLQSKAFIHWIADDKTTRFDNKKHDLRSEDWKYYDLRLPRIHPGAGHVYLIDYESDQIYKDVTLESSEVNQILKLTSQAGGNSPKMTPRLYAFLTTWYAYGELGPKIDPELLFSILEEWEDLWGDAGVIDGRRGLASIKEFLSSLEEFDSMIFDFDISIASSV